jgi:2-polyprenyl-3-methyl-5-hydroxy-6-metoxy-1,4-benzoquinol methylase
MGIGSDVRLALGRWELPAAKLYRSYFINLSDLAELLASLTPAPRVLEIGCGMGRVGTALTAAFPESEYLGIDIIAEPGRLFEGQPARATFRTIEAERLFTERPGSFDLVVLVDVLHHVPRQDREELVRVAGALAAPDGIVAVKDWERRPTLAHAVTFAADRYLSGDAGVAFPTLGELSGVISSALPEFHLICQARIPPHRNNVLFALRRAGAH